jgi:hypothetical protein
MGANFDGHSLGVRHSDGAVFVDRRASELHRSVALPVQDKAFSSTLVRIRP